MAVVLVVKGPDVAESASAEPAFSPHAIAATLTPKIQELILLPTEKCNFRCTYCYEDFKIGRMSAETQRAVELFVERRAPTLSMLRFSWFGGEPLLAREVVTRLSRHAHNVAKDRGMGFEGGLTTNAYLLTPELFEELLSYRQNFYQITLDGWGGVHDQVRKLANGRGTFEMIWDNLVGLQRNPSDFEILLRIHVRRDNIENLRLLMHEVAKQFGQDPRFRLDFEHVRDLGGDGGKSVINPLDIRELREVEGALRAIFNADRASDDARTVVEEAVTVAKQAGESAGAQRASDIALGQPYICYAAKANSLLVRADGRIGKCTVALDDDRNTVGRLRPDGTVEIDNFKLRPWLRGIESLDEQDLGCPLANIGSVAPQRAAAATPQTLEGLVA